MKIRLLIILMVLSFLPGAAMTVHAAPALNRTSCYLPAGKKIKLRVKGVKKKKVTWKSRNKKVATVNSRGLVTGIKGGKARITAIFRYKKKRRKITCVVRVYSMDRETKTIKKGGSIKLDIKGSKKESWESSNPLIAKVSKKGRVYGIAPGTVTIKGRIHGITFTKKIRVAGFTESLVTLGETGSAHALTLKNVSGPVTYSTSNENVARAIGRYVVPVSTGTCLFCAKADGINYYCKITITRTKASGFVRYLETYHKYIKAHYTFFIRKYMSSVKTFGDAKDRILANKNVGITCVVPARWALAALDVKRADGQSLVSGDDGSFSKHYTGDMVTNMKLITAARPVGMTLKDAVDKGYIRKGDILAYEGQTHTFVYSGKGYYVYEGGGGCVVDDHYPNGIKLNYATNFYGRNNCKISQVLRWRP